jgi:hypothetical protein
VDFSSDGGLNGEAQLGLAHSPYMCLNAPGNDLTPRP